MTHLIADLKTSQGEIQLEPICVRIEDRGVLIETALETHAVRHADLIELRLTRVGSRSQMLVAFARARKAQSPGSWISDLVRANQDLAVPLPDVELAGILQEVSRAC